MAPHTSDGRVMFAIPWHGHALVETTDTPVSNPSLDPVPMEQEIELILSTATLYLHKKPLHPALPYCGAEVVWAFREEMARTVEDVLARRTRALFLNARAAIAMAPRIAELMAKESERDNSWQKDRSRNLGIGLCT